MKEAVQLSARPEIYFRPSSARSIMAVSFARPLSPPSPSSPLTQERIAEAKDQRKSCSLGLRERF
jgi:hypothetical protein